MVQGIGFRPFVFQRAREFGLAGWIKNDSSGVTIETQGTDLDVERFLQSFLNQLPPLARIDSWQVQEIPLAGDAEFLIMSSIAGQGESTPVSPEISTCAACLHEMNDPHDRRYRYPFINCTNCGPRFTIQTDIPYDRALTTMHSFLMCAACLQEYENPGDRRFHAQPIACHDCGPQIWFVSNAPPTSDFKTYRDANVPVGMAALAACRNAMQRGEIVAVKGMGGFHLACDARNDEAVAKLRQRKGRVDKPFAVMVGDTQTCRSFAVLNEHERELLESRERPIVLLRKNDALSGKSDHSATTLSELIAPGNNFLGVMLPYSPLHYLLLEGGTPLVMTSGNLAEEPIVRENVEAQRRLSSLADHFLLHDRDIYVVCDDSVVRSVLEDPLPIRRSRGYAPLPVKFNASGPSVLAVGGEIKASFCATKNEYAYLSQHIGDMGNLETLETMRHSVAHFLRLFRIEPRAIASDLHPGYLSANWAKEFADSLSVPCIRVQHHHAHIASLLAELGWPAARPMIGCCFDGTGFGLDQAIWGGELMIADGRHFEHLARLKYIPLPGGDASIRCPYRVALAHLFSAGLAWDERFACVKACPDAEQRILRQQFEKNLRCVPTSSMGRLFDAVASLIGVRQTVNYEAQAALEMEALAAPCIEDSLVRSNEHYRFQVESKALLEANPAELIGNICDDLLAGVEKRVIAARFHHAVAQLVVDVCLAARDKKSINEVGLTGGVFQNVLLLKLTKAKLRECGFQVFCHRLVPPNDGGLALGQALIAQNQLATSQF